jgi:5-(carboxyamino)imidazole ribonucleotide mutase
VVAAHTALPVIGVPLSGGVMDGMDALLSTVQMPSGVPVATVGIDNAKNAALLAIQILALSDEELASKLADHKAEQAGDAPASDRKLGFQVG